MNMSDPLWLGIEGQTWLEIGVGLFVEGFILSTIFYIIGSRNQKKTMKHLSRHLSEQTDRITDTIKGRD